MGRSENYNSNKNSTNNKINKIDKIVYEIKEKIEHQSKIRIGHKFLDFNYLNFAVAFATLVVSFIAMYTSYKISTNNSALNFTYENIDIEPFIGEEGFFFNVGTDVGYHGLIKINIKTKVISGQIKSLYLIQKVNHEFQFKLLNNEKIQDKFSGTEKYSEKVHIDMKKETENQKVNIGKGQLYILSEDQNGKIDIDVIQLIGPINIEYDDDSSDYRLCVDFDNPDYTFLYLKNSKLITLSNNTESEEEWVNLSNRYSEYIKETNIDEIEQDIAIIKERYSRY